MFKASITCALCLTVATVASAGVNFELVPGGSQWVEGDTVTFQLNLVNNTTFDWATVRGVQLSNETNPCGLTYGAIGWGNFAEQFPSFRYQRTSDWIPGSGPAVAFTGTATEPLTSVGATVGGFIDCGTFDLTIPVGTFDPGCDPEVYWSTTLPVDACDWCKVDILNYDGPNNMNPDFVGRVNINFETEAPAGEWGDWNVYENPEMFEGGVGYLYVLPEPATIGLLGLGMLVTLRRRR